jgi:hypothetical protein
MFGQMNVTPITAPHNSPNRESLEQAVARLLDVAEHPAITKWVQFPKALLLFLTIPGDPESGAFYVYDRCSRVWYWVDFEDDKFGGYNTCDFEQLVRECRFLDIVETPKLLRSQTPWVVQAGYRPRIVTQLAEVVSTTRVAV